MEQIQVLTLVFVQALDLHVEEGRWIHRDCAISLDDSGKIELVDLLDIHEICLELRVVGETFQGAELVEISLPTMSDFGGDQRAEARITGQQPAARSYPVRLVVELAGIKNVKLREELLFEKLGVKLGHAIHRVAADNGQMRHPHHLHPALFDQRERLLHRSVPGPLRFHLLQEAFVDLEDDLKMAGKDLLKQADAPLLQRLGEQRMIGVRKRARDD